MVDVVARPCSTPNRSFGLGIVVADGVIATAAHTVEDDLRALTVDGLPATVLAIDARTDLALLAAPTDGHEPAKLSMASPTTAMANGVTVSMVSTGPLVVHDTTAGQRHVREVHRFTPGVARGSSGAPLVDESRAVLGIVVLDREDGEGSYAVTSAELAALLSQRDRPIVRRPGECPG